MATTNATTPIRAYAIVYYPLADRPVQQTPDWQAAFAGHRTWLADLQTKGRLLIAGPLEQPTQTKPEIVGAAPSVSGLVVVLATDKDEAEKLAHQDPLFKENRRKVEVQAWNIPYVNAELSSEFTRVCSAELRK
ncbi:UNVERIFIED_CONTAM: hypothetical protein HDU68_002808 [Siphonaria sp. JEL0065]|nr:hypothetical protein HDU68_002808 [Siphonaria sp. JEL0065]